MRRITLTAAAALSGLLTVSLSGCFMQTTGCGAGYDPTFKLTVLSSNEPELSVRFCAGGKCSPAPGPGKIPAYLTDRTDEHASFIRHISPGEWTVRPELSTPPKTGTVSLYRNGVLASTQQVRLTWPQHDPCAASNTPAPHPTVGPS
jgi:hypothetical protein